METRAEIGEGGVHIAETLGIGDTSYGVLEAGGGAYAVGHARLRQEPTQALSERAQGFGRGRKVFSGVRLRRDDKYTNQFTHRFDTCSYGVGHIGTHRAILRAVRCAIYVTHASPPRSPARSTGYRVARQS